MPFGAESETDMKTNLEFVKFLERSYARGDVYILGGFGNVLTAAFVEQKCRQYVYNAQNKALLMSNLGKIGDDCYGKLKAFVWDNQDGEGHYNINGCPDRNESMALSASTEKGDILTIPRFTGIAVWKDGHVGFVVDCSADDPSAWLVVESYSIARGCLKRTLAEGGWTKWFKDTYLEYKVVTPEPQPGSYVEHIIQS